MRELNIKFVDFWSGFIEDNNYFYNLLSTKYKVFISDQPDLLFYSCYGKDYLKYNCTRVFYSAENVRPDFLGCDYAFTFDYSKNVKHFRLPLFVWYIVRANCMDQLLQTTSEEEAKEIWKSKTGFCCMVVSNPNAKKRIRFFEHLSLLRKVDSGGGYLNNIGKPIEDKLEFIKNYKFVISFENSAYPGYTTEKIIEALMVNSIPVYWGNPLVSQDINREAFINISDFENYDAVYKKMLEIEANEDLALGYILSPKLANKGLASYLDKKVVLSFLDSIIGTIDAQKPVAQSFKKYFHKLTKAWATTRTRFLIKTGRTFR